MTGGLRQMLYRLLGFFRRSPLDRDLDDEMATHLELAFEENLERGFAPAEARPEAGLCGALRQERSRARDFLRRRAPDEWPFRRRGRDLAETSGRSRAADTAFVAVRPSFFGAPSPLRRILGASVHQSLMTQSYDRIDAKGAAGGKVGGDKRDDEEQPCKRKQNRQTRRNNSKNKCRHG